MARFSLSFKPVWQKNHIFEWKKVKFNFYKNIKDMQLVDLKSESLKLTFWWFLLNFDIKCSLRPDLIFDFQYFNFVEFQATVWPLFVVQAHLSFFISLARSLATINFNFKLNRFFTFSFDLAHHVPTTQAWKFKPNLIFSYFEDHDDFICWRVCNATQEIPRKKTLLFKPESISQF